MLRSSVIAWSLISRKLRRSALARAGSSASRAASERGQAHAQRGQLLARVVVQLPGDALALVLLRVDQLAHEVFELRLALLHDLVQAARCRSPWQTAARNAVSSRSSSSPSGSSSRTDDSASAPKVCSFTRSGHAQRAVGLAPVEALRAKHHNRPSSPAPTGPDTSAARTLSSVTGGGMSRHGRLRPAVGAQQLIAAVGPPQEGDRAARLARSCARPA